MEEQMRSQDTTPTLKELRSNSQAAQSLTEQPSTYQRGCPVSAQDPLVDPELHYAIGHILHADVWGKQERARNPQYSTVERGGGCVTSKSWRTNRGAKETMSSLDI